MDSLLPENTSQNVHFSCGLRARSGTELKHRLDLPCTDRGNPRSKSYLANSIKYSKARLLKYNHFYSHLVVEGGAMIFSLMGFLGSAGNCSGKQPKSSYFPQSEKWGKRTQVHSWHPSPWDQAPPKQCKQRLNNKALRTKLLGFISKLCFGNKAQLPFISSARHSSISRNLARCICLAESSFLSEQSVKHRATISSTYLAQGRQRLSSIPRLG